MITVIWAHYGLFLSRKPRKMKLIYFCDRNAYKEFVHMKNEETYKAIRRATNSGKPFGSKSFAGMLELR